MKRARQILFFSLSLFTVAAARGQATEEWLIQPLSDNGWAWLDYEKGLAGGTNGMLVQYGGAVITADSVTVNKQTGEITADGGVRILRDDQVWVSEHFQYNVTTREIRAEQFRTGKPPFFAIGEGLHADTTTQVYNATNAILTTDDVAEPGVLMRARSIKILPGKKVVAKNAILYFSGVPIFYFPYYSRAIGDRANNFNFIPGYRGSFGPFLLTSYNWFWGPDWDGILHFDTFGRRGVGVGPDVNYHLGKWGEGSFRYWYINDLNPGADTANAGVPPNRERVYFSYRGTPAENLEIRSMIRYQGDTNIVREFFEREYRENPQPSTFLEVTKYTKNWSADFYTQPRLNQFLDTVERLPEARLTGFRQPIGNLPVYYESESSLGYYQRRFAITNNIPSGLDYSGSRADTYQQLLLPWNFFGWLNVNPRVGERLTYYTQTDGPGAVWGDQSRAIFNTGAEVTFKASKVWPGIGNDLLDMNGLRHIVQPSFNYVFVPRPNVLPHQLPQFDPVLPSLEMLPNEFPEFNAIDQIDSTEAVRLGLANKLQTKREETVQDLLRWQVFTDLRFNATQDLTNRLSRFSDIYSDLAFKPRSWITLESKTRYDVQDGQFRMSLHTITLEPNDIWGWTVGHFYLADDYSGSPTSLGVGNNLYMSTLLFRFNENWGFRAAHFFEARTGTLQQQAYTIYRDMRSWTAALTVREMQGTTGGNDFSVAFSFSIKARPRYAVGMETRNPYSLWGAP